MTMVFAYTHAGGVTMIGDSAGVSGDLSDPLKTEKVFEARSADSVSNYLIGYSSSFRMGDILRYVVEWPPIPITEDLQRFLVTDVIPAIRKAFDSSGFMGKDAGRDKGGMFLLAIRGQVFEIGSEFYVIQPRNGIASIGSAYQMPPVAMNAFANGGWDMGDDTHRFAQHVARSVGLYHSNAMPPFVSITQNQAGIVTKSEVFS